MTFFSIFCFYVAKIANVSQINQQCYSKCSKCPPSAFTQACRCFLKFMMTCRLRLVVTRPRSSHAWLQFRDVLWLRIYLQNRMT